MGQGRDGNVKICGYRAESVSRSGRGDYFTFRNGFGWCGSSSAETHHKTLAAAGVELHAETRGFSAESAVIRFEFLLRLLRLLRLSCFSWLSCEAFGWSLRTRRTRV